MRTLYLLMLCAVPVCSMAQAERTDFIVNGSLQNVQPAVSMVYLNYPANGKLITDSAAVVNGKYTFKGSVEEPLPAMLRIKRIPGRSAASSNVSIFLDKGTASVVSVDSFSNIKIKGSKAQVDYQAINVVLKPYNEMMKRLYTAGSRPAAEQEDKMEIRMDSVEKLIKETYRSYVEKNPGSTLAMYALVKYAGYNIVPEKVEPLFASLSPAVKASKAGKDFAARLEIAKRTGIGRPAPDFTQKDTSGVPVSLSSFKGKYVLLDFWASWCGPCRKENPSVVTAFETYKDKGFTVLSVSLDQPGKEDKWLDAIHKDNLAWTHVSDLQYWNNAVAKQYGIQSIPQNLLIDPKGVIIAKNLRGKALQAKLAELLE